MKKTITILTALILMFALTVTTGCKKDNDKNPTKTTKEILIGNDWKFTNGSSINGRINQIDTIVSFEADSTLSVLVDGNIVFSGKPDTSYGLFKNFYYVNGDSIIVNFEIEGLKIGARSDKIYNYTYSLVMVDNKNLRGNKNLIRKDVYFNPDGWVKTTPTSLTIKE